MTTTETLPEPVTESAAQNVSTSKRRVRILHDDRRGDPRKDMDLMCVIEGNFSWHKRSQGKLIADLIRDTDAWRAVERLLAAADPSWTDDDGPNIEGDEDVRNQWLERLKDCLLVYEFHTGGRSCYRYVAYTTPEMCAKLGVDWANAEEAMKSECDMFTQWADGDVYRFLVEELVGEPDEDGEIDEDDPDNWEETDSCWGFYGSDPFENGMSEHVDVELHEQLRNAQVEY